MTSQVNSKTLNQRIKNIDCQHSLLDIIVRCNFEPQKFFIYTIKREDYPKVLALLKEFDRSLNLLGTTIYKNKPDWEPDFYEQHTEHEVIENEQPPLGKDE